MKYTVLTLFPEIVAAYAASSIMARAVERGLVEIRLINIRDYATDRHHTCDDAPYGGGPGMLMLPEPLSRALEAAGARCRLLEERAGGPRVVYLSPSGRPFDQALARDLAAERELALICGRYEGIDQRIIDAYVDDEVSVGDYVLSSGEVAALAVIDATYRLVDQVITAASLEEESFGGGGGGLLEYPQYTRPERFAIVNDTGARVDLRVPEALLSGHHERIRRWRLEKRVEKTLRNRPDLARPGEARFDSETRKIIEEKRRLAGGGRAE